MKEKENEMKQVLLKGIKSHIQSWDKSDIYVVSLLVYNENDDPKHPTVTLGYNTNAQVSSVLSYDWMSEVEARWNYACWLQNNEWYFGSDTTRKYVLGWMKENGFDSIKGKDIFDEAYQVITDAFVQVLVEVVQELHRSGFVKEQFATEIPILIHELEYYDAIAKQNQLANETINLDEFVRFCNGELY